MVLQRLPVEAAVHALTFDETGLFLLAGTESGSIHVFFPTDSSTLKFKFKVQVANVNVSCISFVPACHGQPACMLINTRDHSVMIVDCTYGPPAGVLTNLSVRHRVRVKNSRLPLKCCYSPSGPGHLISGSEDGRVCVYSLAKDSGFGKKVSLKHEAPVVAVQVNLQDTLLVSASACGKIVLWRRVDYSHLQEA